MLFWDLLFYCNDVECENVYLEHSYSLALNFQGSVLTGQIHCRGVQGKRRHIKGMVQQKKKSICTIFHLPQMQSKSQGMLGV